ncbi:hypothetical protein M5K25_020912 [Dendrobium thyrsiflorum]|uniref:Secreted protein n=1 Tax=Dendrobium thyrsiflorum TaxID=117978 RepID=A0ABD0UBC3_DENTH
MLTRLLGTCLALNANGVISTYSFAILCYFREAAVKCKKIVVDGQYWRGCGKRAVVDGVNGWLEASKETSSDR